MLRKTITICVLITTSLWCSAQLTQDELAGRLNTLSVAVPFLTIPISPTFNGLITSVPDGLTGSGIYENHALVALDKNRFQSSLDIVPWIRQVVPDSKLLGAGGSFRMNDQHAFGMNFRYFSLGTHTSTIGGTTQTYHPFEWAGSLFYTHIPDPHTGIGLGIKYIHSNLTGNNTIGGIESQPGRSVAADISFARQLPGRNGKVDHFIGLSLTNVGTKIRYTRNSDRQFIPTTLKAGYGLRINLAARQSFSVSYESSKLLVPTPPYYHPDSLDVSGDPVILAGFDPNVGVLKGMMQSFYDAPGGFQEEIHEITHSFGMVYNYRFLAVGVGYYMQNPTKGNQKFFTSGISGNIKVSKKSTTRCRLSVSYWLPVYKNSYLRNTIQLGIVVSS